MRLKKLNRMRRLLRRLALLPLPTRLGWYFLGCGAMLYSAGSVYEEHGLMLLGCLPVALVLSNCLFVAFNLRGVTVRRRVPGAAHAGESVEIALEVSNHTRIPKYGLEIDDAELPDLFSEQPSLLLAPLDGRSTRRAAYRAFFGRRGPHTLPECLVSTVFPFGLARQTKKLPVRSELLIYPRPVRLSESFERQLLASARFFGESSPSPLGDEEIYGVREYRPGESLRRIHWRTSARLGRPVVFEMQGRNDAGFLLLLDATPVGDPKTLARRLEAAVGLCAGIVWFLTREAAVIRFATRGSETETSGPLRGNRQYHAIMERLAQAGLSDTTLGEWVSQVGTGYGAETVVAVSLGPKEHAEAAIGNREGAIVVGATDAGFSDVVRIDHFGRRTVPSSGLVETSASAGGKR